MDDNAPQPNPPPDFNKIDLTQLQGFNFGTQWLEEKPAPGGPAEPGGGRPRREDRGGGRGRPDRRDRRAHEARTAGGGPGEDGPARRRYGAGEPRDDRGGRGERGAGDPRGGLRRDGAVGGERGWRPGDRGPYESPHFTVTFYPEDTSFGTLVQTIRKSCRTIELFEIARTVVAKPDRFVVVVAPRAASGGKAAATEGAEAPRPLLHISVPDGLPYESDDTAVAHVLHRHLDRFFDAAEVEVEPPKGNFQVINRCGVTGELLGPPNYHRYNQIVQQHHAARVSRMPFEIFRSRIETVRDPELIAQWLEKMKRTTRYTWKQKSAPNVLEPAPAAPPGGAEEPKAEEGTGEPASEGPVVPPPPSFDSLEEARVYLLSHGRDRVVRTAEHARFHGKLLDTLPPGEIRRAIEGALERQRRFPLDTANALRGRLRREHLAIFKKGSKGVSYVCAVKRKFRTPSQTFADSIDALIGFIEANPMVRVSELVTRFLGIAAAPPPASPAGPDSSAAEESSPKNAPSPPEAESTPGTPSPSPEDRARIARMQNDLLWLVHEGYVIEFIDGRLYAPPPVVEARKQEIEGAEHDLENFPETQAASSVPADSAPAAEKAPAEAPASAAENASAAETTSAAAPALAVDPAVVAEPAASDSNDGDEAPAPAPAEVAEAPATTDPRAPTAFATPEPSSATSATDASIPRESEPESSTEPVSTASPDADEKAAPAEDNSAEGPKKPSGSPQE